MAGVLEVKYEKCSVQNRQIMKEHGLGTGILNEGVLPSLGIDEQQLARLLGAPFDGMLAGRYNVIPNSLSSSRSMKHRCSLAKTAWNVHRFTMKPSQTRWPNIALNSKEQTRAATTTTCGQRSGVYDTMMRECMQLHGISSNSQNL